MSTMDAPFCYPNLLLAAFIVICVYAYSVAADGLTCYNSTVYASSEHQDVTIFKGGETISCDTGFGCSKTLFSKNGKTFAVSRECGIFGCLGKSCFNLHGHRLCLYCCRKPNCNSGSTVTSELRLLGLSLVAAWLIRRHL